MPSYHFTLIVDGPDLQDDTRIEALFEEGCDDAVAGSVDGIQYVDFDREGPSLDRAVMTVVADVERLEGVQVVRIADAGLASMADIAKRVGRTREGVRLLVNGARGPGGFPSPVTDPRSRYRRWRWREVSRWFADWLGEDVAGTQDDLLAAVSAGLEFRHYSRRLAPGDQAAIRQLVGM